MDALRPQDPQSIGRYTLVARLGAGGMGQVYLGRSPGGRLVAIKVIKDEITDHPEALARFRREVETVRVVRSAYTAQLIDASLDAAPYWLATEYVKGPTLGSAVAERGPFPADTCRKLFAALAEGLAAVHAYGITHRDLKPQNVILGGQGPQLIDFGIARGDGHTALTDTGLAPGTPGFTAPEVLIRNEVGPAADVFALGATLAYTATGRPPFGAGAAAGVSYRAVHEPVDLAGVEPGLAALIEACVAKAPGDRPTSAEVIERCAVRSALVDDPAYASLAGITAAPSPSPTPAPEAFAHFPTQPAGPPPPPRRKPYWFKLAAITTAAAASAVALTLVAIQLLPDDGGRTERGNKEPESGSGSGTGSGAGDQASRGGGPSHINADRISRVFWNSEDDACNVPSEVRGPSGFQRSVVPGRDGTVKIAFRDKYAFSSSRDKAGKAKKYYVAVTVKPPHDIDPDTGRPVAGLPTENRAMGYASKPVDLYGGKEPDDWKTATYPDDFATRIPQVGTKKAIPTANDPGDWAVEFHVVRAPDDYSSIDCTGFTAP
ncbi:serine/threonine-protein kinase [Streptomyces sp. NPDC018029]|uniref:serine/threonine-protein kinase n=1 Tax=Streptomyces sp. NPDC018029 TaxID=3365032 RepID=UPI0037A40962